MRVTPTLLHLLLTGIAAFGADPARSAGNSSPDPKGDGPKPGSRPPEAALVIREARYLATLAERRATVVLEMVAESSGRGEATVPLCEGNVAILPAKLPSGLRLTRDNAAYFLVSDRPGLHRFRIELLAGLLRNDAWNQIEFTGPPPPSPPSRHGPHARMWTSN